MVKTYHIASIDTIHSLNDSFSYPSFLWGGSRGASLGGFEIPDGQQRSQFCWLRTKTGLSKVRDAGISLFVKEVVRQSELH